MITMIRYNCTAVMQSTIGGPAAKSIWCGKSILGGEMGKVIDQTYLNIRMLNLSRGPAVHALRAQADKVKYRAVMTMTLESQPNLTVRQGMVSKLLYEDGAICGVQLNTGTKITGETVVLATGTFRELWLSGMSLSRGRQGEPGADDYPKA